MTFVSNSRFVSRFIWTLLSITTVVVAACSPDLSVNENSLDSVSMSSSEVTLANYRDRKILIDLPPGNRNPQLSWNTMYDMMPGKASIVATDEEGITTTTTSSSSTKKTFEQWATDPVGLKAELDRRFSRTMRSILKDKGLKAELVAAGAAHGIDPILVLACVVGENTFNVGLVDDIQTLGIVATKWAAKWALKFKANNVDLFDLLKKPEFEVCHAPVRAGGTQADYWDCVGQVWRRSFMGKPIDGGKLRYPASDLKWVFFNPIGSGYTYGLGQLDPVRALMVTDMVNKKSGFRFLTIERPEDVYEDIINQRTNVHYVAANVRLMVDTYKNRAGFDISKNPGVIASLYNMGGEGGRANALYKKNLVAIPKGQLIPPMENYYGFYVNDKETLLRQAFERWKL